MKMQPTRSNKTNLLFLFIVCFVFGRDVVRNPLMNRVDRLTLIDVIVELQLSVATFRQAVTHVRDALAIPQTLIDGGDAVKRDWRMAGDVKCFACKADL